MGVYYGAEVTWRGFYYGGEDPRAIGVSNEEPTGHVVRLSGQK